METYKNNNKKTEVDIIRILSNISFGQYQFKFYPNNSKWYLQAEYVEPDVITGEIKTQKTRKWFLSPYMTKSEIVQTAFKCGLTSMEHRTREHFLYKGERIFSPHYDCEALVKLCRAGKFDEREDWYAPENSNAK